MGVRFACCPDASRSSRKTKRGAQNDETGSRTVHRQRAVRSDRGDVGGDSTETYLISHCNRVRRPAAASCASRAAPRANSSLSLLTPTQCPGVNEAPSFRLKGPRLAVIAQVTKCELIFFCWVRVTAAFSGDSVKRDAAMTRGTSPSSQLRWFERHRQRRLMPLPPRYRHSVLPNCAF
jgi:hypothetical protein